MLLEIKQILKVIAWFCLQNFTPFMKWVIVTFFDLLSGKNRPCSKPVRSFEKLT